LEVAVQNQVLRSVAPLSSTTRSTGAEVVARFGDRRAVVVGDALLDRFVDGFAERLCREAPVPVVRPTDVVECPGGAANTAANVAALGARVDLVAVVGADEDGEALGALLASAGVGAAGVVPDGDRQTASLERIRAGGSLLVRVDRGTRAPLSDGTAARLVAALEEVVPNADVLIVSDYGYGAVTEAVLGAVARLSVGAAPILVVDSRHLARYRSLRPTVVKPNWNEAVALLGTGELDGVHERADGIAAHGQQFLDATGAHIAAVTLDREGAVVFERERPPHRTFTRPVRDDRATGAGDTFLATFALALASGADTPTAAELATTAATVVVGEPWTGRCSLSALSARVATSDKVVAGEEQALKLAATLRAEARRIVFTNGCFDMIHRGHVTYLDRARTLGDVLVVGVNSDESVRRLKGAGRPLNLLGDRLRVLTALSCVDYVIPFDGDTPAGLLHAIRPDLYVKGGDHTRRSIPEAELVETLGGEVRLLPFMHDQSTTAILDRMRAAAPARVSAPAP
jgi:D-beta-D-heptose 7-phosphate kinase/D-beta-D-heptose 1-phosphate adenosyltransferase